MPQLEDVDARIRELIAEALGADEEEVTPPARFFQDLGGESIDVIDLSFRCNKEFGIDVQFQDLADPKKLFPSGEAKPTPADIAGVRQKYPFIDIEAVTRPESPAALSELFTVDAVTQTVKAAMDQKSTNPDFSQ